MRLIGSAVLLTLGAGVILASTSLLGAIRPAAAQGGMVCSYGPSSYKACCRESYARFPRMGTLARANDIDACMKERRRGRR